MANNWWKYGLCTFIGLGIGFGAGVKITKDRAEKEKQQDIDNIREIYRNERKAKTSVKKKEEEKPESQRSEITTKTSLQTEKLSEKKEKAEAAQNVYSKSFHPETKPGTEEEDVPEEIDEIEEGKGWENHIHLVKEFTKGEADGYSNETLIYYQDGVLAFAVSGAKVNDKEIPHMIGEEYLKLLDDEDRNEILVENELYQINYTVIYDYNEWAQVIKEEPYKEEL